MENPTYLGDGLYAEFDGFQVKLYASNGVTHTNVVYLEPGVLQSFLTWIAQVKALAR
jgi:hypothetical protein